MPRFYFGGPFDGTESANSLNLKEHVSIRPILELHIGLAGGSTGIRSVEEAEKKISEQIKNYAVYVLDTRNGTTGYYHLMNITAMEFASLANGVRQRLKELAELRGLDHPF